MNNYDDFFESFWALYPKRAGSNKIMAKKQFLARLKKGVALDEIMAGTRRYVNYCASEQIEPQFVKMAQTFLGINQHFLCDWTPVKKHKKINFTENLNSLAFIGIGYDS